MKQCFAIGSVLLLINQAAVAHPNGHNEGLLETAKHMVTQPSHFLLIALGLALLAAFAVKTLLKKRSLKDSTRLK